MLEEKEKFEAREHRIKIEKVKRFEKMKEEIRKGKQSVLSWVLRSP